MSHEKYMQRCLDLAVLGINSVSPNPMVGCVIVHHDKIIGEGYHQKFGEAHAEVNAIKSVFDAYGDKAPALLKEATVYVSLEPCAHYGKTPPCADLLVRHEVKQVVIGNTDPFTGVNGKGIEKLKNAGIEVITGVLAEKCTFINRRFFTRVTQNRPYIILKWAQTQNGFFAPLNKSKKWITGALAKQLNYKWRNEEDAILIGKNTALIDNPQLTSRIKGYKNPMRIVIDRNLEIPTKYHIYNTEAKTIVFNELKTEIKDNIHYIQMEDMHFYLPQKLAYQLYLMDIQSVIVEGGVNLLNQFITAGLWDEARIFTGNQIWHEGIEAPQIKGALLERLQLEHDELTILRPNRI
ncbi:bifunctional diaminohydroxyphosphoribosylaminopyrimidine deaminase/5-amino-6-(5-phosphoribosylamino)uracil reductase RibD [Pedobacter montanisoli]|uniref:Riboflavin biosynthesis protein RibD n=1 Tax=Pedobacter montanisoli TaxID=2923277 RepID=A0ABS9ZY60_9SPHI|nr:bifunctional diaminohydroxyphosphoribosylaminopyrimidine deaminase/5-amino-6-(5-phosphoribosylamino)uracil reductase RibD [Pedobacter montanisoli]MCJ0743245.1 bifunctional diaminohydroxyphosphoribosylaminopyrimidine deaminase/5-amino-6-(5-phosphoribosylamino)uracil reductase RibD [Pedobacter montanisoli]